MAIRAPPSAEDNVDDGSMPALDHAPVSKRTRAARALASVLPDAARTAPAMAVVSDSHDPMVMRVRVVVGADGEMHEVEDEEPEYVHFDGDGGDEDGGDVGGVMQQFPGESGDEYESRLNAAIPPPMDFCCRPVFS